NAVDVRLRQVGWIGDDRVDHEPGVAIGLSERIEEFLDSRVLAIGHAVFPQVSRPQACRDDAQISSALVALLIRPCRATPVRHRISLPARRLTRWRRTAAKMQ